MIELPLTPYFFKKLGIYQELTDKQLTSDKKLWKMEKALLKWTLKNHHHLSSTINIQYVKDRLKEAGFEKVDQASRVMGNLCQRGFAVAVHRKNIKTPSSMLAGEYVNTETSYTPIAVDSPGEIVFTQEGLLAGKVLAEIEGSWFGKNKYKWFIRLIWLTLGVLFIQVVLIPIFSWIKLLFDFYINTKLIFHIFYILGTFNKIALSCSLN